MKLSVCIPVYKAEPYIEKCARSLFEQTMRNDIEFIFVDDGSPDSSLQILQRTMKEYPTRTSHVKIIHHPQNKGVSAARNTAVDNAGGEYVIHCDPDDWVESTMYEDLVRRAYATDSDVVCCGIQYPGAGDDCMDVMDDEQVDGMDFIDRHMPSACFNSPCNKLIRRDLLLRKSIRYKEGLVSGEDLLYNCAAMLVSGKVECVARRYYHYVYHSGSVTQTRTAKIDASIFEVVEELEKLLKADWCAPALDRMRRNAMLIAIRYQLLNKNTYRSLASKLTTPLSGDKRYGALKKIVLRMADISYPLTCCIVRLLLRKK